MNKKNPLDKIPIKDLLDPPFQQINYNNMRATIISHDSTSVKIKCENNQIEYLKLNYSVLPYTKQEKRDFYKKCNSNNPTFEELTTCSCRFTFNNKNSKTIEDVIKCLFSEKDNLMEIENIEKRDGFFIISFFCLYIQVFCEIRKQNNKGHYFLKTKPIICCTYCNSIDTIIKDFDDPLFIFSEDDKSIEINSEITCNSCKKKWSI
jgi:hypothetical protein